ncbi:hypothetical protein DFR76_106485 [Nocardia pseudobrasiliensis]|uniref:Outer membrane channel protein CpnT-like N-terminal domain-containing protein n=2 Tax=Nocardia pseudobrasiliensis TaxID=45979 RepID=A0A370I4D9_9NOCA|nr:hypothetical protein [Nocardia pseudobrasiliensis]RDI65613.1 hypothetical protein DFR76_106485 [Nocardia pseudobrasiliensis]
MSLDLPPELRWLGWIAGSSWPDGDEDAMWRISEAWKAASAELKTLLAEVDGAKQDTKLAYPQGAAAEAMGKLFDGLRSGDQSLESLAELLQQISDSSFDMGTQLQATKLTIIVSLCWLAAEIAWAWLFPPTAAAVEAAAVSTTRSFLRVFEDMVQKAIQNLALKLGASAEKRYFWKTLASGRFVLPTAKGFGVYAVKFGEGAVTSAGLNAAVQLGQMADGKRRSFDGREFGISIFASVAGTLPSREFARYLGNGIDKWGARALNNAWGRTGRGAFIGASAGVVSSVFGNLAVGAATGDFSSFGSPTGWVGGIARGGLVGGARGAFSKSSPISQSDVRYPLWMHKPGSPRTPPSNAPTVGGSSRGSSIELGSLPGGSSGGGSVGGGSNSRPGSLVTDGSHGGGSGGSRPGAVGSQGSQGGSRPGSVVAEGSQGGSRPGSVMSQGSQGGSGNSRSSSMVVEGSQGGGSGNSRGGSVASEGSHGGGQQNSRSSSVVPEVGDGGSTRGSVGGSSGGGRSTHSDGGVSSLIDMYGGGSGSRPGSIASDGSYTGGPSGGRSTNSEGGLSSLIDLYGGGSSGGRSTGSGGGLSSLIDLYGGGGSSTSSVHGPGGSVGGQSNHGSQGSAGSSNSSGGSPRPPTSWESSVDGGWRPPSGTGTPVGTPAPSTGGTPAPSVGGTPPGSPAHSTGAPPVGGTPPGSPAHSAGAPSVGGTPPGSPAHSTGAPPLGGTPPGSPAHSTGAPPLGGTPPGSPAHSTGAPPVGGTPPGSPAHSTGAPPVGGTPPGSPAHSTGGSPAPSVGGPPNRTTPVGSPAPSVGGSTRSDGSNEPGLPPDRAPRAQDPFLGPGKDMKAKTRPKQLPHWEPLPRPFDAPDAPGSSAWIYEDPATEVEQQQPPEDPEDPNKPSVDVPFTL